MFVIAGKVKKLTNSVKHLKTNIDEIDNFFHYNSGIVSGQTIILGAEGGTGKTQLMLFILSKLIENGYKACYISSEETVNQLASTCDRINTSNVFLAYTQKLNDIIKAQSMFDIVVVDSLNMLAGGNDDDKIEQIVHSAKRNNCATVIISHVTKQKRIKGSTFITHAVDTCLEITKESNIRILSAFKNRFASADNQVKFVMTNTGIKLESSANILKLFSNGNSLSYKDLLEQSKLSDQELNNKLIKLMKTSKVYKTGRGNKAMYTAY